MDQQQRLARIGELVQERDDLMTLVRITAGHANMLGFKMHAFMALSALEASRREELLRRALDNFWHEAKRMERECTGVVAELNREIDALQ